MTRRPYTTWNMYGWKEIFIEIIAYIAVLAAGFGLGLLTSFVWKGTSK